MKVANCIIEIRVRFFRLTTPILTSLGKLCYHLYLSRLYYYYHLTVLLESARYVIHS